MNDPQQYRLPDFLIVGAMGAGTTSLARYLDEHPDVHIPRKEAHFFDKGKNWKRGARYYAQVFSSYSGEKRMGEKTPAYCFRPDHQPPIPERIAEMLPGVQLIWCLRNPVDRAYSHWWHSMWHGRERVSFEAALQRESCRPTKHSRAYRQRGVYVQQIRAFMPLFPLERMHFLVSERLFTDPRPTVREVYEFLAVDPTFEGQRVELQWNPARRVAWPLPWHRILVKLYRRYPRRLIFLRGLMWRKRPKMKPDTRRALEEFFKPYNQELAELVGLNPNIWR